MQYARSKVDYVIGEFIYMLPSNMNLRIGKVKNYNNKILVSSPSFNLGINLKINIDGEKNKPDAKSKGKEIVKTKPNTGSNKERKQDVKSNIEFDKKKQHLIWMGSPMRKKKVALVLGITSIFTVWWMFK